MGMTATQKIIAAHAGLKNVTAGQLVTATVDLVLANDITAPVAIKQVNEMGGKIKNEQSIALVLDHFTPNKDIQSATQCKLVRDFAALHNIKHFYDVGEMGVEHALLPEQGLVSPASLIIGADSHTCTYGALGCFSTGVGSTDAAVAMVTGKVWLRVPAAYKIILTGKLKPYVTGKDIALHLIGILGVDGATYKSLEFFGDIESLTPDERFTVANMAVECGAKNAFFPIDNASEGWLYGRIPQKYAKIVPDEDAEYERTITINLNELSSTVAFPHLPSNTKTFDKIGKIKIDQVVIGSCTNGRLDDMRAAAEILRGRKVKKGVRCIIFPATQAVYLESLRLGYIEAFIKAGAAVSTPTCGCCLGGHMGILAEGEACVSTTNRNFVGRMGHTGSEVYLASPYVAAASAITGELTHPERIGD